ncbi:MAG: hypothetical protein CR997_06890 [Acidobacteria bacterium]|nr:MAG: hypothetical protein CR997_06890 [Acidobacteriota bacterium]
MFTSVFYIFLFFNLNFELLFLYDFSIAICFVSIHSLDVEKTQIGKLKIMKIKWSMGGGTLLIGLIAAGVFLAAGAGTEPVAEIPFGLYAPEQPIPYSHKLHAGDFEMDCSMCHTYARRTKNAGIPALEQCMMCHKTIALDKDPIKTMAAAYSKDEPIKWIRVHALPGYVNFNHKRHVKAGFECQECHGQIQEMEVVYREAPLTMGWCLQCHKINLDKGASVDCWTCHK